MSLSPSVADWIGYTAAFLTTSSFLPQAWLTFRTRDTSGISLGMYAAFTLGVALWLAYGVVIGEWPVIAANAITLALAMTILAMKLRIELRSGSRSRASATPGRAAS